MGPAKLNYTTLPIRQADRNIFVAIKDGRKTIETRPFSKRYRGLRSGDGLRFVCGGQECFAIIKRISFYKDIDQLAEAEDLSAIFPTAHNAEEFRLAYHNIPGLLRRIEENGVAAFELGKITS